ncbi:hypothetical protein R4K54_07450 [Brachyspira murdochii]|uniref:Uncharacterized protein n=1 Tax=Brachyspira murdochii (strain ATCC 51284 / DSM 12563 / 56-150) TaxID=526224 RepID=D5U3M5_BRAM5|nr:hypothetical protein [Brachyspira murdochii]ADG72107.1 conserved hypothetical protein [Brachyspira murdochii DSM 12563]
MKDVENIFGEEKIIHNIYANEDTIIAYIKSFDNVLYCDYSYGSDNDYLMGLFAYHRDNKYIFGEFGSFKENRDELKLVVSDYPEIITIDSYELTNDKFIDLLNLYNISMCQMYSLLGESKIKNIKTSALKKITLNEYKEIFPHRYINNRIKMYGKGKYERAAIYNILDDLAYRCPYCGATSLLKIIDNKVNNFKDVLINELYNEHMENSLYLCRICNLISRTPNDIMDYI